MMTSYFPFKADTVSKLKRVILNGDFTIPSCVSDSCRFLIRGILKPVPADRFTIQEIMDSAWLNGEQFVKQHEPYNLIPNSSDANKVELKKEEIRTIELLENLGITKELLNGSNANFHHALSRANSVKVSTYPYALQHLLENNSSKEQTNYMTPELQHCIKGTYQIVYHRVQKEMRKEYLGERIKPANLKYANHSSSMPNTINANGITYNTKNGLEYVSNKAYPKSPANQYEKGYNKETDEENEDENINKTIKHVDNSKNPALANGNSLFVRLNSQTSNGKANGTIDNAIFVNYDDHKQIKNKNSRRGEAREGHGSRRSSSNSKSEAKTKNQQPKAAKNGVAKNSTLTQMSNAHNLESSSKQQSSKLCTII
jgi:hypothetical protein